MVRKQVIHWRLSEDWIDVGMDCQAFKEPGENRSNGYGSEISRRRQRDHAGQVNKADEERWVGSCKYL